jgi:hypothetical protein
MKASIGTQPRSFPPRDEARMTLIEHLGELRSRIIKVGIAFLALAEDAYPPSAIRAAALRTISPNAMAEEVWVKAFYGTAAESVGGEAAWRGFGLARIPQHQRPRRHGAYGSRPGLAKQLSSAHTPLELGQLGRGLLLPARS